MRTFFMAIAAALLIGLAMPSGAHAAAGDHDQSPGSQLYNGGKYYKAHGNHRYRKHRRHRRNGIYFYYSPSPRYYYAPRPRRYYNPRPRARRGSCAYWSDRCAANWGYGGPDYRGCMRYYRCY